MNTEIYDTALLLVAQSMSHLQKTNPQASLLEAIGLANHMVHFAAKEYSQYGKQTKISSQETSGGSTKKGSRPLQKSWKQRGKGKGPKGIRPSKDSQPQTVPGSNGKEPSNA